MSILWSPQSVPTRGSGKHKEYTIVGPPTRKGQEKGGAMLMFNAEGLHLTCWVQYHSNRLHTAGQSSGVAKHPKMTTLDKQVQVN